MPGNATWPVTINGNTYQQADFDGFNYVQNFPAIISDINVIALQAAADRAAIQAALAQNGNLLIPQTSVRLDYVSANSIRLGAVGGGFIWVNGLNRSVPNTGVLLSNTGLSALTFYYIYAYMNGATMMLEASTTVHVTIDNGIRVKNNDPTRTLVGAVYMDTGVVFVDNPTKRYVRSFYNRPSKQLNGAYDTGTTSSTTAVETNANFQIKLITFFDDVVDWSFGGHTRSSDGSGVYTILGFDGNNSGPINFLSGTSGTIPNAPRSTSVTSDGLHTLSLRGYVANSAQTGSWTGSLWGSVYQS